MPARRRCPTTNCDLEPARARGCTATRRRPAPATPGPRGCACRPVWAPARTPGSGSRADPRRPSSRWSRPAGPPDPRVEPIARRRRLGYGCPGPHGGPIGLWRSLVARPRSGRGGPRVQIHQPDRVTGSGSVWIRAQSIRAVSAWHTAGHGRAGEGAPVLELPRSGAATQVAPPARPSAGDGARRGCRGRRRRPSPAGPPTPTAPVAAPAPALSPSPSPAHAGPDRGHPAGRPAGRSRFWSRRHRPSRAAGSPGTADRVACSPRS